MMLRIELISEITRLRSEDQYLRVVISNVQRVSFPVVTSSCSGIYMLVVPVKIDVKSQLTDTW